MPPPRCRSGRYTAAKSQRHRTIGPVTIEPENLPGDLAALQAAPAAEREARCQAEARASRAGALVSHYKLLIAKLRREQYGQPSERGRKRLGQLDRQLAEAAASAAEEKIAAAPVSGIGVRPFTRRKPVRTPFPPHLPRERVVAPAPKACSCCGGKLAKLGETITETLEVVPRQWKVIQTVREKFACRACEKITQPPAPALPTPRGRAAPVGFPASTKPSSSSITSRRVIVPTAGRARPGSRPG